MLWCWEAQGKSSTASYFDGLVKQHKSLRVLAKNGLRLNKFVNQFEEEGKPV